MLGAEREMESRSRPVPQMAYDAPFLSGTYSHAQLALNSNGILTLHALGGDRSANSFAFQNNNTVQLRWSHYKGNSRSVAPLGAKRTGGPSPEHISQPEPKGNRTYVKDGTWSGRVGAPAAWTSRMVCQVCSWCGQGDVTCLGVDLVLT